MKCNSNSYIHRNKVEERLPETRGREKGLALFMGTVLVWDDEKILETDRGDGFTAA